jgi:hypothetical protein
MTENRFGDSLVRGLKRFGLPSRLTTADAAMVDPEKKVTTSAFDADKNKAELLGPMTANEARLFRQGGFTAVIEDRRYQAKEAGDPTWKEIGKTRYTVKETTSVETMGGARTGETVREGTRPETVQGTETGQQEPRTDRETERVSVLPGARGPVAGAQGEAEERSPGDAQAGSSVRPGAGAETAGAQRIRAWLRSREELGRQTTVEASKAVAPSVLPGVQAEDRTGSEKGNEATSAPVKRRGGRPRKYATDAERKRAWRARG